MNATQLLKHFDRLAEAPNAVPRLRRFILDLAVRGKLVAQDVSDEPALGLLARIREEKYRLTSKGFGKREKPLAEVDIEEIPFAIPSSWSWTYLQNITSYIQRGKSPIYAVSDGVPVISQKCVQWRGLDLSVARLITKKSLEKYEPIRFLQNGDILWNSTGTGTIGRVVRLIHPPKNLVCDSHVTVVRCTLANSDYVRSWLASDHVYGGIEDRAAGATNQVELNSSMATRQVVPLPPLAEQHRIVAKVDELMALCDQLEAAQQERERRRDRLAAASLKRLNKPAADTTPEAQRGHARFHLQNLPRLTTRPEHIKAMWQTILNLAVRGKLLEQDANDEPATALLKRIQAEKARLAKLGRIKVEKVAEPIEKNDGMIPSGWALCRWNSIAMKIGDIDHKMPDTVLGGVPYVSPRDFYPNNVIDFERAKRISREDYLRLAAKIKPDFEDLIYPRYGTIGENRLVTEQREFLASYSCAVVKTLRGFVDPKYQYIFSISGYCKDQAKAAENKTTQANVGIASIQQYIVPLPPLAEQHRIVAKVDELMALCDQLEAQLTATQTDSRRLLEAVLEAAVTPV
jgi:type I restriction enzyme S subunit